MAAQVEVQTAEIGRTVAGGRHHLSPSNNSLIDIPSVNEPHRLASEPNKPVPTPKPRLTPKPFSVQKNPTIKPILAPKPHTKPRPESTCLAGYKPELPSNPKPQQPVASSKPRPVSNSSNRPASTSFNSSPKLNTGQTTKPVVQPFKPAPHLDTGDPSRPTPPVPAERQKPTSLAFSKNFENLPAAEWSGTTTKEDERGQNGQGKGLTSLTRAKSMGFLLQAGQEKEAKEKVQPETSVPLRPHPRGTRPRPVSAIFPSSPNKTEAPLPAPRWSGRRPLSADLTAKFESIGLSLHHKVPEANTEEGPQGKALPQKKEEEDKTLMSTTPQSTDDVYNSILSDHSNKNKEEMPVKEADEDKRRVSIKSRISLLLDSPSSPGVAAAGQGSDLRSPMQPTPEIEPPVGVKQLIKQLTEDTTPTQSPVLKQAPKPRPLPLDLTKRFSAERSPDPVFLTEAVDRHDINKDPQKRAEESPITPNDQKTFLDLKGSQEQPKKVPSPEGPEAGQPFGTISKESGAGNGVQTVRASLFDNIVERHSVLMMDEGSSVNMTKDLLSSPSPFKRAVTENDGTLFMATYSQPLSPSSPLPVLHAFDTVQAVEESRAVSESIPSAHWEDKAMTLRSRRSEGSRPLAEWTGAAEEQPPLAVMPETQPRYLRIGALQKWAITGLDQDVDMEKGMLKESQREGQVALDKDRERQRMAEQEEVAAAPKRLKILQAEEIGKPRATYFALTGQIQEAVSLEGAGTNTGDMTVLFDDSFGRSVLGGPQVKSLPIGGSPSLDDPFGKNAPSQEQEELITMSHKPPREIRSALDGRSKEEKKEAEKKMEQKKEKVTHKTKMKEVENVKQKQLENEKQAHSEFAQMKAREMQNDFERQRQEPFEKEKQEFEEKQYALDRQKQTEFEKVQELEREKQRLEREKQRKLENEKRRELERQRQIEREKIKERERQREKEQQKQKEEEQLVELQRQKQKEKEMQQLEKQRLKQKKEKEAEKLRQMALEQEMLRIKELEREREMEKERQKEIEREKQRELEKRRQRDLERERQRQQAIERRELENQRLRQQELERKRKEDIERLKELERLQLLEYEKQKQAERERQQIVELEKWKQLDAERQELENQRLRQQELEKERKRKEDIERLKELERLQLLEFEKQKQAERERQQIVELEKQRKLDTERQELENQRLRQQELEKERKRKEDIERLKELERLQLLEFEKQKQAERERQHIVELEKRRQRESVEREEADRMRVIAKQQEAERQRLKEKQRKEEQERLKLESSSPLRPKVLDLDSVLRTDPISKSTSQRSDAATRWKEPYKPGILDIDSFTSQAHHSPNKDLFPLLSIQGLNAESGGQLQPTPESDVSWKMPPLTSVGISNPVWTTPPQDPWELRSVEMSVDQPKTENIKYANKHIPELLLPSQEERIPTQQRPWSAFLDESLHLAPFPGTEVKSGNPPGGLPSSTRAEQIWLPRELQPQEDRGKAQRRSHGSQELNRLRSRSVSRRSTPAGNAAEGGLSRIRSRSAHREQDRHSWVQQKQSGSGEEEGKDSPVRESDSQYGTWETGLRTDDSLTPVTPSSDSNLSPSPRKPTPAHTPGDHASPFESDTLDVLPQSSSPESQPLSFPDAPTTLLDTSVLRSRAQLGKKRAPRTRPTRAARQSAAQAEVEEGTTEDWLYRDSTETKAESKDDDSDSEQQPKGADAAPAIASQPHRVALFPGMDPSALKVQLKKRGDSDNQTDGPAPSPSQLSRSPKSPFLPRAARVLPPSGGKENGEEDSPQWLKELKSKKRLSQYENES